MKEYLNNWKNLPLKWKVVRGLGDLTAAVSVSVALWGAAQTTEATLFKPNEYDYPHVGWKVDPGYTAAVAANERQLAQGMRNVFEWAPLTLIGVALDTAAFMGLKRQEDEVGQGLPPTSVTVAEIS